MGSSLTIPIMKIFNVRLGFATNSSSSHSLVFLKPNVQPPPDSSDAWLGSFGWSHFIASSPQTKANYLALMLAGSLSREHTDRSVNAIIRAIFKGLISEDELSIQGYVDHQSQFVVPRDFENPRDIDHDFARSLAEYLLRRDLVVLGGSDQDDQDHPFASNAVVTEWFKFPLTDVESSTWVCRYDPKFEYWCLFNRRTGSKVRMILSDNPEELTVTPQRAFAPELVDIKITDHCPYGCPYCYQGSTPEGEHAPDFFRIIAGLQELRVFEVALGGGEPTLHPQFLNILRTFRDHGIVPNFTTRNYNCLTDINFGRRIFDLCGAVAFSVSTSEDVQRVIKGVEDLTPYLTLSLRESSIFHRVNLNVVLGTVTREQFKAILVTAGEKHLGVTLLGYKTTHRGAEFTPLPYDWVLTEVKALLDSDQSCPHISMDTPVASEFEAELEELDVPRWLFTTREGDFSCYIDAVRMVIGPSSFCGEESLISIPDRGSLSQVVRNAMDAFNNESSDHSVFRPV